MVRLFPTASLAPNASLRAIIRLANAARTVLLVLAFGIAATPAYGQRIEQALTKLAITAGRQAGSAEYCRMDRDKLDAFISQVMGRLSADAADDAERAFLRIAFKNQQTAASAREPEGGCPKFLREFTASLKAGL